MQNIDPETPPAATGPLIREFRPRRRRASPVQDRLSFVLVTLLCLCLAAASIAGPALHLFMR
jgi:hypothetical protein